MARKKKWTKEKVIKEIRKMAEKEGKLPASSKNPTLTGAAYRVFGSWNAAIEAAGYKPRPTSKQSIIEASNNKENRANLIRFVYCLNLAKKSRMKMDTDVIAGCMKAVNRGALDKYNIVIEEQEGCN